VLWSRDENIPCAEVDAAVARDQRALDASRAHLRPLALFDLATSLFSRHRCTGDAADLDRAITHVRSALRLPLNKQNRATLQANLAVFLQTRHRRPDIEEAIRLFKARIAATPRNSALHGELLGHLAGCHSERYNHTGEEADLDTAVRLLERAVDRVSASTPEHAALRANLAVMLANRYTQVGMEESDLDRALGIFEDLDRSGAGADVPGFLHTYRTNLASTLLQRYHRHNDPADLAHARRLQEAEADRPGPLSPELRANSLNTGAAEALENYHRSGGLHHLDRAVDIQSEVIRALRPDDHRRAASLLNLGHTHVVRHAALKAGHPGQARRELDEALRLAREIIALPPPPHQRTVAHMFAAMCLLHRYTLDQGRRAADLEDAFRFAEAARNLPTTDTLTRNGLANLLAQCRLAMAVRTGDLGDLDGAITVIQGQRDWVPAGSPHRAGVQANLANALLAKAQLTGDSGDARAAAAQAREACTAAAGVGAKAVFEAARTWGNYAWTRRSWSEAGEAYTLALEALHDIALVQLGRDDKELSLGVGAYAGARAAYALVRAGDPEGAVVALESGRALMLTEALERDRADLDRLDGDLLGEYREAAERVAAVQRGLESADLPASLAAPVSARDAEAARHALDEVVERIRAVPGFTDFLRSPGLPALRAIAQSRAEPLVYLAATDLGGIALVLPDLADEPVTSVPLPDLTLAGEAALVERYLTVAETDDEQGAAQLSGWLWQEIMAPVMDALRRHRRAVLIPCGRLGLLPLHAAGRPDPSRPSGVRYALDDIAFSHAPNARALASARVRAATTSPASLVTVASPAPVSLAALPWAAIESGLVSARFPAGTTTFLSEEDATYEAVRDALPNASVHHFACHGRPDPDPMNSGPVVSGDRCLTVRDVLGLRMTRTRLVALSACHTAVYGERLPDEVVSLPTGLLQAGAAGIVASLWWVDDVAAMLLMDRFFRHWLDESTDPPEALRRAQCWLRDATNAELQAAYPELAELTGSGDDDTWGAERDHTSPLLWAAFTFVGA
jgi:CHAT domain-containing protein/tetratricopeptide (TPR) repeat protein